MTEIIAKTRECGDCMMCCKLPAIEELEKPPGKWCILATPGVRCDVYEARPNTCREFNCTWKIDMRVPEAFRPDKVKTNLAMYKEGVLVVYADKAYPTAWKEGEIGKFLECWPAPFILETGGSKIWVRNNNG